MEISVALNGAKHRDMRLYAGDEDIITVVVYEKDGDETPINNARITNLKITTEGPYDGSLQVGVQFEVPNRLCGRNWFTLTGEIDGIRKTLAFGWILNYGQIAPGYPWGNDYGWRYGPCNYGPWGYGLWL